MLTGKQVRVRVAKNKLLPMYLDDSAHWRHLAGQLLAVYRGAVGRTRGEIEGELANFGGDGPQNLILQGLAKLLEDRCEYEIAADHPPEEIRDAVFKAAAIQRSQSKPGDPFDRAAVMAKAQVVLRDVDPVEHEVVVLFPTDREVIALEVEPLGTAPFFVNDDPQH